MLKLKYIEAFCLVVRLGSISAAADALFCVPSNITKMIKELESGLSSPLFNRDKGRLTVTTFGLNYFDEVSHLLMLASNIEKKYKLDTHRTLRIGTLDVAADNWLPSKIVDFQKLYPGYMLKVFRRYSRDLEHGLLENKYDVIFSDGPLEHPEINSLPVFNVYLQKIGFPSEDIGSLINVYSFGSDCLYRTMIEGWINNQQTGNYHIVDIESYPIIRELIINGFGISFVPQNIIADLHIPEEFIDETLIKANTCVAWARFREDVAVEQFIKFINE